MGFQNIYLNIYFYTQIECFNKGLNFMKKKNSMQKTGNCFLLHFDLTHRACTRETTTATN